MPKWLQAGLGAASSASGLPTKHCEALASSEAFPQGCLENSKRRSAWPLHLTPPPRLCALTTA
eukprot:12790888-Alexandrium_andersonii.AAC.1